MKINIISDLHLENAYYNHKNDCKADILFLAGDICQYMGFDKRLKTFLEEVSPQYDSVYYIPGNHEYYSGDYSMTSEYIRNLLPKNVTYLDNEITKLGDYTLIGGTLWNDLSNPLDEYYAERGMNDYLVVWNGDRKLRAHDTTTKHKNMVQMIEECQDEKIIVLGHHLPSYMSVAPMYQDSPLNCAFATELSHLMNDRIKLWVHGHTHGCLDYEHNGTRVICNPKGYHGENQYFYPEKLIEL